MSEIERWTIKGHDAGPVQWSTGSTLVIGGRPLGPGERVEVVPAARLEVAVEERDICREGLEALLDELRYGVFNRQKLQNMAAVALDRLGKAEDR
jgi:hypothetical protein